ncbi:hypothetical protein JCGZ_22381 [Jatropha curcas]|uniref:C2H2-type domain-containing protein n=1 Tax=Jatropha curcas TaxID=180498 RepID=A0A067LHU0_JATCU|nr:uncharacterized protein LOC119371395 [Jatropha curcas]KDP43754.1 hypothetical protein JCGZ_22381 [Jatropha curcas]
MDNNANDLEPEKPSEEQQIQSHNNSPENAREEDDNVTPIETNAISPPRPVLETGASSTHGSRKRRGRNNDPGASLSMDGDNEERGDNRRRRKTVNAGVPAVCAVCSRRFPSFYSLFGHLRSHTKRDWGGAFPPPVYNPDWGSKGDGEDDNDKPEQQSIAETQKVMEHEVIPALLDVAKETLAKMKQQEEERIAELNVGSSRESELDLNVQPQEDQENTEINTTGLDLNLPPKEEEDEDAPSFS